jgi:flagellin-like hook-associated protein FlgL
VTTDTSDHNASVLLGNGDGSFKARTSMSTGFTPGSVALGDLNGDGILDIVTADSDEYATSVFLGNGNGSFKARSSFSTGPTPLSVKLGDLNGDGALDIVTVNQLDNSTSILLGNGNGSFKAMATFQIGSIAYGSALGDLNGDGVLDIVISDSDDNTASVLLGTTKDGISPILPFSLKSIADARQAMSIFSNTANNLGIQKGKLGAFESRLSVAVKVVQSTVLEYQGAYSRIADVDVAEESSRIVSTKILQQSAVAVLAQANQSPALVLQLLG